MKAPRILHFLLLTAAANACLPVLVQAAGQSPAAIYEHSSLSIRIPFHAARHGSGRLYVEILDPEDEVLGQIEKTASILKDDGYLRQSISLDDPKPLEDLVWDRIHYRFVYDSDANEAIEGIDSISRILLRPSVRVLGQQSYLAGSDASIRIVATDSSQQQIVGKSTARVELVVEGRTHDVLFSGPLNRHGTTEAHFRFPTGLIGSYQLHFVVDTPLGSAESVQAVKLEDKASILLTTEKPVYQPGQSIHVRALALDRASHQAEADRALTFELEDSRGNKVFKKATVTDKFGISSAEFALADEVNLGTYHLKALMGDEKSEPRNTAEIALNVERYVLPKFKVTVEFTEKNGKPIRDYRPGDHITGTVRANYFFGKPVDGAKIDVKASAMDVSLFEASSVVGKTDRDGNYRFDLKLPNYFAGRPISVGAARVLVEATVKDSAGHSEVRGEPVTVSQSSLLITAIPESGSLIPHLDNQVFILTSYPDGTPAHTSLNIHRNGAPDEHATTDNLGVAVIHVTAGNGKEILGIDANDGRGSRATSELSLAARDGVDQILLHTERAVYRIGDRIQLKVLSTRERGTAYIDVVKDGQTIVTRDLEIENGHADLTLTATPAMAGTVDFNAYLLGRDAQTVGDHRLVFVQPPDDLRIEAVADAAEYKPGAEARVHFRVTNARGEGVSAALGLQVVDEAVFALAEKQPGFAKVFFYLEQEAMKPRYEIHSLSMNDIVESVDQSKTEQQDRAARALFAATEFVNPNKIDAEFGQDLPRDRYSDYAARYQTAFYAQVSRLSQQFRQKKVPIHSREDLIAALTRLDGENGNKPRDAWGTELRVEATRWNRGREPYYLVRSAGPDKQFNTADDMTAYLNVGSVSDRNPTNRGSAADIRIEHDRGPFNGRAEVTGLVKDQSGAVIPGADVELAKDI
jgi:hypothetical protein